MDARVLLALGLLVLGTMYLWSSPAFVKPTDVRPDAPAWSERFFAPATADNMWNQGLLRTSLLVVLLFAVAAFGVWRSAGQWWVWVGLAAAVLGMLVLLPWWFAVGTAAPAVTIAVNVLLALWALGLVVALLSPGLRAQVVRLAGGG